LTYARKVIFPSVAMPLALIDAWTVASEGVVQFCGALPKATELRGPELSRIPPPMPETEICPADARDASVVREASDTRSVHDWTEREVMV